MNDTVTEPVVVEDKQRLSRSMLWRLQRRFFRDQTIDAWRHSIVPHYVTSNTFIAQAYARLVFGYLRDLSASAGFDPQATVYILELGAGSGRFSFHFLKKFFDILQQSTLRHLHVKYVMSDLCQRNLDFWRQHPRLQTYVEQGVLDFTLADVCQPAPFSLQHSGLSLGAAELRNPLVVIANYVFDGVEQDAFYINNGILHESLISLNSSTAEDNHDDTGLLQRLDVSFTNCATQTDYYPEAEFNLLLAQYQQRLVDSHILLPVQALRYVRFLRELSGDRLLLISGDKGHSRETDLLFAAAPAIARHGSISMMVNYHAIGQYVQQQQGIFLSPLQRHHHLHICAALFDQRTQLEDDTGFAETRQAFSEHIGTTSPDDFYTLKRFILANCEQMDLQQLISYLRLSGWDAANFWGCLSALQQQVSDVQGPMRQEVLNMVEQIWATYYFLGEDNDLAYALSSLLYEIDAYPQAIRFLEYSRASHGAEASTLYNLAMCHYNLHQLPLALELVEQALQLEPAYEPARVMRITIRAELG